MYLVLAIVYFALLLMVILFLAGASRLSERAAPQRHPVMRGERIGRFVIFSKRYRDVA